MDGPECSEIMLSALERSARMDAEFYQKRNLTILSALNKKKLQPFTKCFHVSDGNHMSISHAFRTEGIPYYRGQDSHHVFIEESTPVCIDSGTFRHPHMLRSHLRAGDVLISIVGTVGNSVIVSSDMDATCSCKLAILRNCDDSVNPETLLSFIKTSYGQNQIQKFKRGAVQTGLLLDDFDQLLLPEFGDTFQAAIKKLIQDAHSITVRASELYASAQDFLLAQMQFDLGDISKGNTAEKSFSASAAAGRLDAEHSQPKYDALLDLLKTDETVGSLCRLHDRNFIPESHMKYAYIELANVGQHSVISKVETMEGSQLPGRARRRVKAGQVIISSIEGSLQSCALITKEYDGALCSNGFYVLDSDMMNPETLLLLFQSEPIQELMRQRCSGTILTAISKEELLRMPLPLVPPAVQQEIAERVTESFALRRQAQQRLESAVRAVEIAIGADEAAALAFINART